MDLAAITVGISAVKAGFDTAKTAISIVKETIELLPNSRERQQIENALANASAKMTEGEASVAIGLGYTLCRCSYPPAVMLKVGTVPIRHLDAFSKGQALSQKPGPGGGMTGSIAVHECPRCGGTDLPGYSFERTAPPRPNNIDPAAS